MEPMRRPAFAEAIANIMKVWNARRHTRDVNDFAQGIG